MTLMSCYLARKARASVPGGNGRFCVKNGRTNQAVAMTHTNTTSSTDVIYMLSRIQYYTWTLEVTGEGNMHNCNTKSRFCARRVSNSHEASANVSQERVSLLARQEAYTYTQKPSTRGNLVSEVNCHGRGLRYSASRCRRHNCVESSTQLFGMDQRYVAAPLWLFLKMLTVQG